MGYPDCWDIEEVLEETYNLVKREMSKPKSSLFVDVTAAGRLQQIEAEIIHYRLLKEDLEVAAQISIRMLHEDEFTFPDAQEKAVEAVARYMMAQDVYSLEIKEKVETYQKALKNTNRKINVHRLHTGLPSDAQSVDRLKNSTVLLMELKQSSRGDVTMEVF